MIMTREERIAVAEATIGHRIGKGVRYLPGARNRILFALQATQFPTANAYFAAATKVISAEEIRDPAYYAPLNGAPL